jgi:hypothetical protein
MKDKLDSLLQLTDVTQRINEELLIAFQASCNENAALKAAVDDVL